MLHILIKYEEYHQRIHVIYNGFINIALNIGEIYVRYKY